MINFINQYNFIKYDDIEYNYIYINDYSLKLETDFLTYKINFINININKILNDNKNIIYIKINNIMIKII